MCYTFSNMSVEVVTQILSVLAIIAQVTTFTLLLALFLPGKKAKQVIQFFGRHAIVFALAIVLVSTLGSLFYSEIAGYTPCKLCWYQRILMYPQVLLLGMAFLKKDKNIVDYSILLSGIGAAIALYHYLLQRGAVSEILPCSTVGYSVSCAKTFVMTYGYITIPLMALSAFCLVVLLMIAKNKVQIKK